MSQPSTPPASPADDARRGVILAFAAYLMWGLLPLYLKQMMHVPALQIVAHRLVWSLLLLIVVVTLLGRWKGIGAALRTRGTFGMLMLSATFICFNWLIYTWAVLNGHVLEASLGYFINPLVNVALGMIFLKEQLRRVQGVAVALAALGVAVMAFAQGGAVWISLTLALSFGLYGLVRKVISIDALGGLTVETALLAPLAIAFLGWTTLQGDNRFGIDRATDLFLIGGGVVTALPLLLFAAAARKLRYATIGLIQYLAPTLVFFQGVLLFGEALTTVHIITFGLIWTGLLIYAADSLRAGRATPVSPPE
ncbi:chloramphenicol-sensitive protein RarD [Sphingomonas laterariae]|uniref:Chloramphenicol-sensitive protein RarD n=1 Tax=Edaphosphingomonas laterariae TaxID=861865 RepID=A0A239BW21_9SPHN|nr:EamA family transporter RarD [Sphingomonas laterariae]SNS12245.1 chloramphenicol-sensitive protein RarD [Sphingomonas laterariae]